MSDYDLRLNDRDKDRWSEEAGELQMIFTEYSVKSYTCDRFEHEPTGLTCDVIQSTGEGSLIIQLKESDKGYFYRFYGLDDFLQNVNSQDRYSPSVNMILKIIKLYLEAKRTE